MRLVLYGTFLVVASVALGGCMSVSGLVEQLKDDPATVCASYVGIYGNFQVSRTAAPNATVTCSKDGLTVRTTSPAK